MKRFFYLLKAIILLIITITMFMYLDKKHPDKHITLEDLVDYKY